MEFVGCAVLKLSSFIPPVVALAIAGGWIGAQHQSLSALEKESVLLRKHIATARASAESAAVSRGTKVPNGKTVNAKEPIDWKKVAGEMAEMQRSNGMGDMRTMIRIQQRLQSMTKEELVAALDQIATLELPAESRNMLEQMLIGPLVEKDPELALTRFADRFQDQRNGISWQLSNALGKWAEKEPGKATAWFDEQIAAGKFDSKTLDGKSQARLQFEGALIRNLLSTDPAAAGRRLGALPEDQRADALRQFSFREVKEEDQKVFADLVRAQVPENQRNSVLSHSASNLVSKGYPEVTAYLDRIEATPAERAATVDAAATSKIQQSSYQKGVTREDLDAMREWANSQAPGTADGITGKALARSTRNEGDGKFKFADAAALAVQYHESSGNDDVLVKFLEGWQARQNKDESIKLAEKISDPARREEILKNLR